MQKSFYRNKVPDIAVENMGQIFRKEAESKDNYEKSLGMATDSCSQPLVNLTRSSYSGIPRITFSLMD